MKSLLHYAPNLFYAVMTATGVSLWLPEGDWLWILLGLAAVSAIGVVLDAGLHRGRLCERCAAKVPLNGSELAAHHSRPFRAWHWMSEKAWRYWAIVIVVVVTSLIIPGPIPSTLLIVLMIAFAWTTDQHMRLRPWCPFCRWGGGGDHEESPLGPPTPAAGR